MINAAEGMSNIRYEGEKQRIGICFSMKYYDICEKTDENSRQKAKPAKFSSWMYTGGGKSGGECPSEHFAAL